MSMLHAALPRLPQAQQCVSVLLLMDNLSNTVKAFVEKLATNNWVNLLIALVCLATGVSDVMATAADVSQGGFTLRAGHGLATLGAWQAIQAVGAILSSLDYASKAADR